MKKEAAETYVVTGQNTRFSYPHLFEPYAITPGQDEKYSLCAILPKSDKATAAAIKKAVEAAVKLGISSKWGGKKPANLHLPLRDGDTDRPEDEAFKDAWFLNISSKQKPMVVDNNLKLILDSEQLKAGDYGRVSINFYPYSASGNNGVAAGLSNVQKLKDGESLGGRRRAEDDFSVVEDEDDLLDLDLDLDDKPF